MDCEAAAIRFESVDETMLDHLQRAPGKKAVERTIAVDCCCGQ